MPREFGVGERAFYDRLEQEARAQIKQLQEAGGLQGSYVNMLYMLLRLRQACNHPWLVKEGGRDYRVGAAQPRTHTPEPDSAMVSCPPPLRRFDCPCAP